MAEVTPNELLGANYDFDEASGELRIKLSDLLPVGELLAAEANEDDGNGVKVAFALIKTITENLDALATEDAPTRMTAYQGSFSTNADDTVTRTYTQSFQFEVGDVADEPDESSSP